MGCCCSRAEAPPSHLVGEYRSIGGRNLTIDASGMIVYRKPGLEVSGIGMSGWESDKGASGSICCFSVKLDISEVEMDSDGQAKAFIADGDKFRRMITHFHSLA